MQLLILLALGLITGSFLSSLTWRLPQGIDFRQGRSFCPQCKKKIDWWDNIPLISFLLLKGRCRRCQQKISCRYPLIEITTAGIFVLTGIFWQSLATNLHWLTDNPLSFLLLLFLWGILISLFIIDLENQILPDELIFLGGILLLSFFVLINYSGIYEHLFAGFLIGGLILFLNLLTAGKGMGLGDVKLACFLGLFSGLKASFLGLLVSFLTGGLVASILILIGRAKLKSKIAFGPFLILGCALIVFLGQVIWEKIVAELLFLNY